MIRATDIHVHINTVQLVENAARDRLATDIADGIARSLAGEPPSNGTGDRIGAAIADRVRAIEAKRARRGE